MNRANNTNRKANLVILIVITSTLLTGIYTTNVRTVFADSRILKQETNQNANCDTVGAASPVSDSCNQRAANNVNNGVPKTTGTPKPPETTGTVTVRKVCSPDCPGFAFDMLVQDSAGIFLLFTLPSGGSQPVTVSPGQFRVHEVNPAVFIASSSGDCEGTISAGQHLTCTWINHKIP